MINKRQNVFILKNPVRNANKVTLNYPVEAASVNHLAIKIFLKSQNNNQNKYNLYNFYSSYSEGLATIRLSKNDIQKIFPSVAGLDFSKISIAKSSDQNLDVAKIQNLKNDCQTTKNTKKEVVSVNGKNAIQYTADSGNFCDHFSYPNLPHSQGYIVSIQSKNITGLPITLCVSNYTSGRCDVYSDLTAFTQFGTDNFLLPPMDDQGIGYDINLENLGIKGTPSVNLLSSIEFIPIPYGFLQNIQINSIPSQNLLTGRLIAAKQINPLLFEAKTNGDPVVLNLAYDYEPGWKAYRITCSDTFSCFLKENIAPIFGTEVKEHVLVNNWSNGWILGKAANSNERIVIMFLPQHLEFFGFLLIVGTFIFLFYFLIRKK